MNRSAIWRLVSSYRPRASRPPSRFASRLGIVSPRRLVAISSRRAKRPCVAFLVVLLYRPHSFVVIALASSRLVRLVLRCVGRDGLIFRSMSSGILGRIVFLLTPFVVAVSVSWRGLCWEIELTKTARFAITVVSVSSGSCSSCRGDGNRTRSNGSETRGRCRSVRMPGRSYMPAGRFRKTILTLAHPTPWGRGTI